MLIDHIRQLFDFTYWGHAHLLKTAEALSEEQFLADSRFPLGGVRDTLVHTMAGEWLWRSRFMGETPKALLNPGDFPNLPAVKAHWKEEEKAMRTYLADLSEGGLSVILEYRTTDGKDRQQSVLNILTQLVFHGMQHHAEIAQMLTEFGHSPGNIDYLIWLRQ